MIWNGKGKCPLAKIQFEKRAIYLKWYRGQDVRVNIYFENVSVALKQSQVT